MKRIQVRPGKYVTVSSALAEKAAAAFASVSISREQLAGMVREPHGTGVMAGSPRHPASPVKRTRSKVSTWQR
jgi:hypothetical protein